MVGLRIACSNLKSTDGFATVPRLVLTMITPLGLALYWLFNTVFDIVKIKIVKEVSEKQIKEKGLN